MKVLLQINVLYCKLVLQEPKKKLQIAEQCSKTLQPTPTYSNLLQHAQTCS